MTSLDGLSRLRERATAQGIREDVRVNQRHLVDKILARYSGESVVWRELIQNSDDAGATEVHIEFRTNGGDQQVTTCIYKNNGKEFKDEDWHRLRSIAEGNPDESKIGFFGVGFYSVFSISEEPMVVSGGSCMVFGWDKDSLYCRVTSTKDAEADAWTTFVLTSRDVFPVPKTEDIGSFASSCLAFSRNVSTIRILVNEKEVVAVQRKQQNELDNTKKIRPLVVRTPRKLLSVVSSSVREFSVVASAETGTDRLETRLFTAVVKTSVPWKLSEQMERVTKKKPPRELQISFVAEKSGVNEKPKDSQEKSGTAASMTQSIVPKLGSGRVFIGFPTHQTTGAGVHLSAPLIPTVERESVDFVQPALTVWNSELLFLAGSILRGSYEQLMGEASAEFELQKRNQGLRTASESVEPASAVGTPEEKKEKQTTGFAGMFLNGLKSLMTDSIGVDLNRWSAEHELELEMKKLLPAERVAVMLMKTHTFIGSTPDKRVGELLLQGFLAHPRAVSVMTEVGARPASEARVPNNGMEEFTVRCPVVKRAVAQACFQMMELLSSRGGLNPLRLEELVHDLELQVLSVDKFLRLCKWWSRFQQRDASSRSMGQRLKSSIVVSMNNSEPLAMRSFKYLLSPKSGIPVELSIPSDVLPRSLGDHVVSAWRELKSTAWFDMLPFESWAKFACEQILADEGQRSNHELVLKCFSTYYSRLASRERDAFGSQLRVKLENVAFLETSMGVRSPADSYLSSVVLFDDLPRVSTAVCSRSLLVALGVRDHVDLEVVFSRLDSLKWDPVALIRYLASVQGSFSGDEWRRLRLTPFLPVRRGRGAEQRSHGTASELFVPDQSLFELGFLTLEWTDKKAFKTSSPEGRFLHQLGVREHPSAADIIDLTVNLGLDNRASLVKAVEYLAAHVDTTYAAEYVPSAVKREFLPAHISGVAKLESPGSCFTAHTPACMGFAVVDSDLRSAATALGVKDHPSADEILLRARFIFEKEFPRTVEEIYDYLSARSGTFERRHWSELSRVIRIPVLSQENNPESATWLKPSQVFFEDQVNGPMNAARPYSTLFRYVDFGASANALLRNCGVRDIPSIVEIVQQVISDPELVLDKVGNEATYIALLKEIAVNFDSVPQALRSSMLKKSFLLGFVKENSSKFCRAAECSLVDDTILLQLFEPVHAPLDSTLESFYEKLGSKWLSKEVTREYQVIGEGGETTLTHAVRERILERAPLLLTDSSGKESRTLRAGAAKLLTEERLRVKQVSSITCLLRFRGRLKTQPVTCCSKGALSLLILKDFDMFDVSHVLGANLFERNRLEDSLLITTILETSISALKSRGFPVNRLSVDDAALHAPRKQSRGPPRSESPAVAKEPRVGVEGVPHAKASPGDGDGQQGNAKDAQVHGQLEILRSMFPDADEEFISKILREQKGDPLRAANDILSRGDYPRKDSRTSAGEDEDTGEALPRGEVRDPGMVESGRGKKPQRSSGSSKFGKFASSVKKAFSAGSTGSSVISTTSGRGTPEIADDRTGSLPAEGPGSSGERKRDGGASHKPDPTALSNSLKKAVSLSGPQQGNSIQAQPRTIARPPRSIESNCEVIPGHDLVAMQAPAQFARGCLKTFRTKAVSEESFQPLWPACLSFSKLLLELGTQIFNLNAKAICVVYEPGGKTIAFNSSNNHALHFNLYYFMALEHEPLSRGRQPYVYWYFVYCHELAHNIVGPHDEVHEFYFQSFADNYFDPLMEFFRSSGRLG
mmetsp:Transcript_42713/g.166879  ORF Transcript_42713/g.166879 Transcript_42713/m.166879 type:complete len:1741 (-) Transcript_42713:2922-8144(-)